MFCKHCGKKIKLNSNFCIHCGAQIKKTNKNFLKIKQGSKEEKPKTYSSMFWDYFWINVSLGIFGKALESLEIELGILWLLYYLGFAIFIYYFCKMINEAMLSVGKKDWWPVGFIALIPFGFWITFFIVRFQLKAHNKWSGDKKEMSLITKVGIIFVAVIIISTLVLVAMGGARKEARDTVRKSDMRQIISGQEMYYGDNEAYLTNAQKLTGTVEIPSYLRILHDPLCSSGFCLSDWANKDYTWEANTGVLDCTDNDYDAVAGQWFCIWAELEVNDSSCITTTYMTASHKGTLLACNAPTISSDCTCFIK